MNARSFYVARITETEVDPRGALRQIKVKSGINKGKRYPYASVRQITRQRRNYGQA